MERGSLSQVAHQHAQQQPLNKHQQHHYYSDRPEQQQLPFTKAAKHQITVSTPALHAWQQKYGHLLGFATGGAPRPPPARSQQQIPIGRENVQLPCDVACLSLAKPMPVFAVYTNQHCEYVAQPRRTDACGRHLVQSLAALESSGPELQGITTPSENLSVTLVRQQTSCEANMVGDCSSLLDKGLIPRRIVERWRRQQQAAATGDSGYCAKPPVTKVPACSPHFVSLATKSDDECQDNEEEWTNPAIKENMEFLPAENGKCQGNMNNLPNTVNTENIDAALHTDNISRHSICDTDQQACPPQTAFTTNSLHNKCMDVKIPQLATTNSLISTHQSLKIAGWLWKRWDKNSKPDKRWVVLRADGIYYFKREQDENPFKRSKDKPKGFVPLHTIQGLSKSTKPERNTSEIQLHVSQPCADGIDGTRRILHLSSESEADIMKWHDILSAVTINLEVADEGRGETFAVAAGTYTKDIDTRIECAVEKPMLETSVAQQDVTRNDSDTMCAAPCLWSGALKRSKGVTKKGLPKWTKCWGVVFGPDARSSTTARLELYKSQSQATTALASSSRKRSTPQISIELFPGAELHEQESMDSEDPAGEISVVLTSRVGSTTLKEGAVLLRLSSKNDAVDRFNAAIAEASTVSNCVHEPPPPPPRPLLTPQLPCCVSDSTEVCTTIVHEASVCATPTPVSAHCGEVVDGTNTIPSADHLGEQGSEIATELAIDEADDLLTAI